MTHLIVHLMNDLMKLQTCQGAVSSVQEAGTMAGCFSFSLPALTACLTGPKGLHSIWLVFHPIGLKRHLQHLVLLTVTTVVVVYWLPWAAT